MLAAGGGIRWLCRGPPVAAAFRRCAYSGRSALGQAGGMGPEAAGMGPALAPAVGPPRGQAREPVAAAGLVPPTPPARPADEDGDLRLHDPRARAWEYERMRAVVGDEREADIQAATESILALLRTGRVLEAFSAAETAHELEVRVRTVEDIVFASVELYETMERQDRLELLERTYNLARNTLYSAIPPDVPSHMRVDRIVVRKETLSRLVHLLCDHEQVRAG